MHSTRHIFNLIWGFILCIVLVIVVGPTFFREANDGRVNIQKIKSLDLFTIQHTFDSKKYIQLKIVTNNKDTLTENYYIKDQKHKGILTFLKRNGWIKYGEINNILPLSLSKKQLESLHDINVKVEGNTIKVLVIDGNQLIGIKPTPFRKGTFYFLGGFFILLGFAGLMLLILVLRIYYQTGELPGLPNKMRGLGYILRGFKSKKN